MSQSLPPSGARVAVAMSGGVDSAVAALLLVEAGYAVAGVTLKFWCPDEHPERDSERTCCSREAIDDAAGVAARLRFPHYVWDFGKEFRSEVIIPFRHEYSRGRTPNPCVDCNRHVRFRVFYQKLRRAGYDCLATGHYARVFERDGRKRLLKGVDSSKDQSYVLWGIGRQTLASTYFPIGDYHKEEVRALAAGRGLAVAGKEESQDICFIPDKSLGGFLGELKEGDILDSAGNKVGTHAGAARYTIGQRRGLGISANGPLYVTSVDVARNVVFVGRGEELLSDGAVVGQINLLAPEEELTEGEVAVKIRYRHEPAAARVVPARGGRLTVCFADPQRAVTPGQSAVFYRGNELLGGGVIEEGIGA